MSYVNTENEAYQKLNNWQKWLVHFSQNALTRFIYQLLLLADLIILANNVDLFKIKSISTINYNPIVLPIGLMCLFIIQFGWLFSWYAMVNHEKRRQTYFKWIYSWLALVGLLIVAGIALYFSTISLSNKLVYTSLCFFIGWFGYEIVTALLHLQDQIKISPIVNTDEKTFFCDMKNRQVSSETIDEIKKCYYQGFYEHARKEITINNNINSLPNIIKLWLHDNNDLMKLLVEGFTLITVFIVCLPGSAEQDSLAMLVVATLLSLLLYLVGLNKTTNASTVILIDYGNGHDFIECSNDDIVNRQGQKCYRSDTYLLKTDWSDVKYRNRNQHDTITEEISHKLHLAFNGQMAHHTYVMSLIMILSMYLFSIITKPINNFINMINSQITKLISLKAIEYSLVVLIVIAIVVTLCYLEYAYLCKQK